MNWKHRTLFGKDYDWQYGLDQALFKELRIPQLSGMNNVIDSTSNYIKVVKYDGKILKVAADVSADGCGTWNDGYFYISAPDTDIGWAEAIAPNADEVKVFMNGWKALSNVSNRYVVFASVVDGSLPSGVPNAVISATTNTTSITVSNGGTRFKSGDLIVTLNASNVPQLQGTVTGTPTETNIPVTGAISVTTGQKVMVYDVPASSILTAVTWCKNNIAPNYEGYQLHYKLANPEPITDVNVHIHGDIPKLDNGDNYLYLDYGMVLGEAIAPYFYTVTNPHINDGRWDSSSWTKYKTEGSMVTYKNLIMNPSFLEFKDAYAISYGRGNARMVSTTEADTNATYTVDYQILKTMHTSPTTVSMSYPQDVLNAISYLSEMVENKQNKDSALDNLVDLSIYEKGIGRIRCRFCKLSAAISLGYVITNMTPKKTIPIITILNVSAFYYDGAGTAVSIPASDLMVSLSTVTINAVSFNGQYIGSNTAIHTALQSYGGIFVFDWIADCRGRI